jgi:hypothetical protein
VSRRVARALAAAFALACAAGFSARPVRAAHVTGQVNTIQRPLGGAQVIVLETGTVASTDSLGRFDLGPLGPGVWSVRVVAVGYVPAAGTVSVGQDSASAPSAWLLKPLHPDGAGLTHGFTVPRDATLVPPPVAAPQDSTAPTALPAAADEPPAIAPILGLYLSDDEVAARPDMPGPLGELLPQIALSDSLTAVSAGTSAPGAETWRQWADRIAAWATANPGHPRAPLARRAVAYSRTRLALADGRTWAGYQAARTAREAVGLARLDATAGAPAAAFLDSLGARLDSAFVPGSVPPKPVAAPRHRAKHRRSHRPRAHS